ncbi:hypothetical protein ACWATR_04020 [Nostoc sp. UIC 10890]
MTICSSAIRAFYDQFEGNQQVFGKWGRRKGEEFSPQQEQHSAQQETSNSPWDSFKSFVKGKPQEFIELRNAATELAAVVVQVARSGNMERINRVRELLEQVKREIYAILAEK